MDLEEALKPTPIITPVTRSSKDLNKRKKSAVKKDPSKIIDHNYQVDSQNFPALGQQSPNEGMMGGDEKDSPARGRQPRSESKPKIPGQPEEQTEPVRRVKTLYNSSTPVMSLLDASCHNMRMQFEQDCYPEASTPSEQGQIMRDIR